MVFSEAEDLKWYLRSGMVGIFGELLGCYCINND